MPGVLIPGDLELILDYQQARENPTAWLLENFQASEGGVAMKMTEGRAELFRIPTIVPRLTETGCIFLKDGKCTIHAVSPFGCAFADVHKGEAEANTISRAMGIAQMQGHERQDSYAQAWKVLADAGKMAPPLIERKNNLVEALERIERDSSGKDQV
jgi:Fe-S-cluster containining protein